MINNNILIYGETYNNSLKPVVSQLITKSVELRKKLSGSKVIVCVITSNQDNSNIISEIEKYGADEIVIVSDNKLENYNNSYYPEIFKEIAVKYNPLIIIIGATQEGKEIASYTATKLETGLTADCTNLDITDKGELISTRPTFGGQLTADIMCKTYPQMATVRENTFCSQEQYNKSEIIYEAIDISQIEKKIEIIKTENKNFTNEDVASAKIIVSGGLGACSESGFKLINEFADKIGAVVAGSREAYERGYITKLQQIGQTGKTVAPKLYIAIGISGANQHLTGIKNSGKIVAINKDKNAPIFQHADIGIVGDLYKILPELISKL